MYVAVKGGEQAIIDAHRLLAAERRGDPATPELTLSQIAEQLGLAVDRVMTEGSIYDRELAALAIKQARGDLVEAIFLLRAYRATLPRLGVSVPLDTAAMSIRRRVSATFKDVPGGQILGPTFDYTHRLLDFSLADEFIDIGGSERRSSPIPPTAPSYPADGRGAGDEPAPSRVSNVVPRRVVDLLDDEGLIERESSDDAADPVPDLTRHPLAFPAPRASRLQNLARGDEGFVLALGYATQRGYGYHHPFAAEIRLGEVEIELAPEELGFSIVIGEMVVTECQMVNQFTGSAVRPPQFTRGYGLAFGHSERKAMAMALVDRALRAEELGEARTSPTQDAEFVLSHSDNVEAAGFVGHLKLPHHVDFQSELVLLRTLRAQAGAVPPR